MLIEKQESDNKCQNTSKNLRYIRNRKTKLFIVASLRSIQTA